MDLTESTEYENLSREISHLFRSTMLVVSGRKANHRRIRAENEIKTGLEI